MADSRIDGVRLAGIAMAVPANVRTFEDDVEAFGEEDARKISAATGVRSRRVAGIGLCTSDLCAAAADRLLNDLDWDRGSLDALVFVSQTPDHVLPSTSCLLQARLNLPKRCAAFDVNLGCSGYVYGLWIVSSLLAAGGVRRALLLVGDTISRLASPLDRSVAPLFGDAGTATALEWCADAGPIWFNLGTDGAGGEHLIVPAGGFRRPRTAETSVRGDGIRSDEDLLMNGAEVFAFTLREVQPMVKSVLSAAGATADEVDAFVFHQANSFMLKHLARRMRLPENKVVLALEDYGNTSSASIPLTLTHVLSGRLKTESLLLALAGFGVGFSWGAAVLRCGPMVMSERVDVSC